MRKVCILFAVMVTSATILCACSSNQDADDFYDEIIEQAERVAEPETFNKGDIYIDSILYGNYSQAEETEMLVLCKFKDNPHVAGLDRTLAIVFSCQSLDMVAYKCFGADEVVIRPLPTESGENRILFLGRITYQGLTSQHIGLFCIENNEWTELALEKVKLQEDELCYITDVNTLVVLAQEHILLGNVGEAADREAITYSWNPESAQFDSGN